MCLGLKYGCSDSMKFRSLETSHVFTHFSSLLVAFSQCSQMSHCDQGPGTACRVLEIHPKSSRGGECTECTERQLTDKPTFVINFCLEWR